MVDSGTFTLYLEGARIGVERFIIRRERAGSAGFVFRAGAELSLKLAGSTMRVSVALETVGPSYRPLRYESEINGSSATTIVGTLSRDRIRLDVRSPRGDEMKEFLVPGQVTLLDKYVAHHYFFACKLLAAERYVEASIIVPRDRNQETVRIVDQGVEPVSIGSTELELRHITIVSQTDATHHVWLDGDRVMKVEVPEHAFLAVRSDNGDSFN
ncbi:MAG: hypothetical protein GTO46_03025 [Gemmatimonadetes bacterium]|nr:hypothetical protein [Gemmatimonadota bacterium]NIO30756.1 hypothetical protein [Gemmatimonadota bacterium]